MHIPFFDLQRQYASIRKELEKVSREVFSDAKFIGGSAVTKFEKEFASRIGANHCIGTGNGTDALFVILKSLNLPPGSEVITPAWSCIPSSETITLAGLKPVFCDVHPRYFTVDASHVSEKITSKTKAIVAVHLYGQAAELDELKKLCDKHQLCLIEDCAQSHITMFQNQIVGTAGVASAFSFYPTKNLGAFGDAGCIVTGNTELAERMRRFANHGVLLKDDHRLEGTNTRLDSLQAAFLSVKLKYLVKWNERRRQIASYYNTLLTGIPDLDIPAERPGTFHTYHIYCIRLTQRDALKKYLADHGVETAIHYPKSLPFTDAYSYMNHSSVDFPVAAKLQELVLSLPIFPELTDDEVQHVGKTIQQFFE